MNHIYECRILIIDDNQELLSLLLSILKKEGWQLLRTASSCQEAREAFRAEVPDLIILDVMLPDGDGFALFQEFRAQADVPILFLSSTADNLNIIMAVNLGGDDFLPKPFDLNILLVKVQALLRRAYDFGTPEATLEHQGAVLDPAAAVLVYEGRRLPLTKNECRILQTLLEQKGKVVGRDALMERLWETDSYVDENALTVNVARLRRKLEGAGLPGFITTKKGMGYLIDS